MFSNPGNYSCLSIWPLEWKQSLKRPSIAGVLVQTYNSSTRETKTGGYWIQDQPRLHDIAVILCFQSTNNPLKITTGRNFCAPTSPGSPMHTKSKCLLSSLCRWSNWSWRRLMWHFSLLASGKAVCVHGFYSFFWAWEYKLEEQEPGFLCQHCQDERTKLYPHYTLFMHPWQRQPALYALCTREDGFVFSL